ncbi:MAG: Metal-dependent phosphohydrolase, subdomain [Phycisphaerales bacterium]|nr:Metal-dependent phosphohydrolase, subdomain [Phycisphaerales bacterium]
MITILVVDDVPIFRDPIAATLRLAGYQTTAASNGLEALATARANRPDLILLDLAMPVMDGLTCLRALRANAALVNVPVILLTAMSEKRHVLEAAKLGVTDYLLKSRFSLTDLLTRVKGALGGESAASAEQSPKRKPTALTAGHAAAPKPAMAPSALDPATADAAPRQRQAVASATRPLPTREECLARAEKAMQMKTLSGVVAQVIAAAASPNGSVTDLAQLISRDSMLSARVLQAANSAAYASGRPVVSTIPDAIRKIGCTTVRNLAAAMGVFDIMPESSADGFNPIHCWQHSFAVAQLCEQLASASHPEQAGLAYVVGLCHDLAEIFIHLQFNAEFRAIIETAEKTGRPQQRVERELLGITCAELSRTVFRLMGLPDAIREPIEILHGPRPEQSPHPLARILWMAENYANGIFLASSPASTVSPLPRSLCHAVTGNPNPPLPDAQRLRSEVLCLTAMLARLSKTEEKKLLEPMFHTRPVKVCLVRDPSLSRFDPIEIALKALAEVQCLESLPKDQMALRPDAILVVSRSLDSFNPSQHDLERATARAGGGSPLPLLWITAGSITRGGSSALAPKPAPVRLVDLAAFVDGLGTAITDQATVAA